MNQDQDMVIATLRPVNLVIEEPRAARTGPATRRAKGSLMWMAYSASLAIFVSGLVLHAMASMSTQPLFGSAARAPRRAPTAARYQPTVEALSFTLRHRSMPTAPKPSGAARSTRQAPAPAPVPATATATATTTARTRAAAGSQAMTDEVSAAAATLAQARREQSLE